MVMAFEEVCPDRIDLIHKNYRKLCNLLVDVEEWGQVVIISMLTRYARTQFISPWQEVRRSSEFTSLKPLCFFVNISVGNSLQGRNDTDIKYSFNRNKLTDIVPSSFCWIL